MQVVRATGTHVESLCELVQNEPYVLVSRYDRESSKASRVGVPLSSAGRLGYDTSVVGSPPRDYSGAAAPPEGVERQTLSSFKKRIIPVIAEYFDSGDIEEVSRCGCVGVGGVCVGVEHAWLTRMSARPCAGPSSSCMPTSFTTSLSSGRLPCRWRRATASASWCHA